MESSTPDADCSNRTWHNSKLTDSLEFQNWTYNMIVDNFNSERFRLMEKYHVTEMVDYINERYQDDQLAQMVLAHWIRYNDVDPEEEHNVIGAMFDQCQRLSKPLLYLDCLNGNDIGKSQCISSGYETRMAHNSDSSRETIQTVFMAAVSEERIPQVVKLTLNDNGISSMTVLSKISNYVVSHMASCYSHGQMYFSGGDKDSRAFYSFEVGSDVWIKRRRLITERDMHCLVAVGPRIFVVGGFNCSTLKAVARIEMYTPSNKNWLKVGTLVEANWFMASASYQNKIVMFGGRSKTHNESKTAQYFDTSTQESKRLPDLPFPVVEARAIVTGNNAYIISIGKKVIKYNLVNNTFILFIPCPFHSNFGISLCGRPNRIHVFGGKKRYADSVGYLEEENNTWCVSVDMPIKLKLISSCNVG